MPPLPPPVPMPIPPPGGYFQWSRKIFPNMKRRLKRLFNLLYNSNDFNYRPSDTSPGRREISDARADLNLPGWLDGLSPGMQQRIIFEDPLCLTGGATEDAPRGTIPGYDGTVADRASELAEEGLSASEIKDQLLLESGYGERVPRDAETTGPPPEMPGRDTLGMFEPDEESPETSSDEEASPPTSTEPSEPPRETRTGTSSPAGSEAARQAQERAAARRESGNSSTASADSGLPPWLR